MKKKQKELLVHAAFKKHSNFVQIPIMAIGKILKAGMDAETEEAIDKAVKDAVDTHRAA